MKSIAGIDLSLKMPGLAIRNSEGAYFTFSFETSKKAPKNQEQVCARWLRIVKWIFFHLDKYDVEELSMEGQSFQSGNSSRLAEIHGIVRMQYFLKTKKIISIYPPAAIRKAIFGNGRFQKSQVMDVLLSRGYHPKNYDESDALAVLLRFEMDID